MTVRRYEVRISFADTTGVVDHPVEVEARDNGEAERNALAGEWVGYGGDEPPADDPYYEEWAQGEWFRLGYLADPGRTAEVVREPAV